MGTKIVNGKLVTIADAPSDNTRVERPLIARPIQYKPKPGEYFVKDPRSGKVSIVRSKNELVSADNRSTYQRLQSQKDAQLTRKRLEDKKVLEEGALLLAAATKLVMPSTYVGAVARTITGDGSLGDNLTSGEGFGDETANLVFDLASPFLWNKTGSVLSNLQKSLAYRNRNNIIGYLLWRNTRLPMSLETKIDAAASSMANSLRNELTFDPSLNLIVHLDDTGLLPNIYRTIASQNQGNTISWEEALASFPPTLNTDPKTASYLVNTLVLDSNYNPLVWNIWLPKDSPKTFEQLKSWIRTNTRYNQTVPLEVIDDFATQVWPRIQQLGKLVPKSKFDEIVQKPITTVSRGVMTMGDGPNTAAYFQPANLSIVAIHPYSNTSMYHIGHEKRHFLDYLVEQLYRIRNASKILDPQLLLRRAYPGIKKGEATTTNFEIRKRFLESKGLSRADLETLNKAIDSATDLEILDAMQGVNGYLDDLMYKLAYLYIKNLSKVRTKLKKNSRTISNYYNSLYNFEDNYIDNKHLGKLRILLLGNIRNALKHVPSVSGAAYLLNKQDDFNLEFGYKQGGKLVPKHKSNLEQFNEVAYNDVPKSDIAYAKTGIKIKKENKGKFTESAKRAGLSVLEHAKSVLSNPNSTKLQKKRALFAINAKKWKH